MRAHRRTILATLAGAAIGVFALLPGTGQAGISGNATVNLSLAGNGAGNVSQINQVPGQSAAVNCNAPGGGGQQQGTCRVTVPFGAPPQPFIGLQANPVAQSEFTSWQVTPAGTPTFACGQQATCFVQANPNVTVTANFQQVPGLPVTVVKQGAAANLSSVTSNPAGINCTATDQIDCSHSFNQATNVTFTATPGTGATFGGWGSGPCAAAGTSPTCTLGINGPIALAPTFNIATQQLSVSVTGDGGVSSNIQPGISCSTGNAGTCQGTFAQGSQVSLTATADSGWAFSTWGGACTNNANPCVVTLSQSQQVSATFTQTAVQASVVSNRIRKVGPRNAVRQLQVTVNAEEALRTVVFRVRRGNTTLQSKTFRNVDADQQVLAMNLRNGIAPGRAQLTVIMTNASGTQLTVNRGLKIPGVG